MSIAVRITLLSTLVAASAGLTATVAHTREPARSASFVCPDGERFSVEYLDGHVRLRTGAGVFSLASAESASGARFTDGRTVFWNKGDEALLERPHLPTAAGCRSDGQRS